MERLLRRFVENGDEEAIEELVRTTRPRLLSAARRIAPDYAEDAVQTAYHSLLRKGAVPEVPLLAWLYTAVVRIAYRWRAKQQRQHEIAQRLAHASPRDTVDADDLRILRGEVARLPAAYRDVVVLHYLEGLRTAEVARLLDLSEAGVRQRLHRARKLLRGRLSPHFAYALLFLPWTVGGVMKTKTALAAAVIVLLLAAAGVTWRATRTETPTPRAPATKDTERAATPAAAPEEKEQEKEQPAMRPFASGVVLDHTLAPLPGVKVLARGHWTIGSERHPQWVDVRALDGWLLTVTDDQGRFEVPSKPEDLYGLVFFKRGFVCKEKKDLADNNENLRVVLETGRRFAGVVRDTGGNPIPYAKVSAWPGKNPDVVPQNTQTDEEGRFAFDTLGTEPAMGMAVAAGYDSKMVKSAGEVDVTLVRNAVVIDADVSPVAAVVTRDRGRVFVAGARRADWIPSFPKVPGRLVISVSYMQHLRKTGALDGELHVFAPGYRAHREPLRLKKGEEPPHLRVQMTKGEDTANLAGTVTGAGDAIVELRAPAPEGFMPEHGDSDRGLLLEVPAPGGVFRFPALPAFTYRLVAKAPGAAPSGVSAMPPDTGIRIELRPACALHVTVFDRAGKPVPHGWVHAESRADERRYWNAQADKDGVARFTDLPPGAVELWPRKYDARFGATGLAQARVSPDGVMTATVAPAPRLPVTLLITRGGAPAVGVGIQLTPGGLAGHEETNRVRNLKLVTDESGRVTAELSKGQYHVRLRFEETQLDRSVEVTGEGEYTLTLAPKGAGVLHGRVVERGTTTPIAHRPLYVFFGRERIGRVDTDAEGRYRVTDLPAGKLFVSMSGRSRRGGGYDAESPYPSARREIELGAGETRRLDWALPRVDGDGPVEVSVFLSDAKDNAPLNRGRVEVHGLIDGAWMDLGGTWTDKHGRGTMRIIAAERYRAYASGEYTHSGTLWKHKEIDVVPDGNRLIVEVALERK